MHRLVDTTREEKAAALRDAQDHLHSWGIVGWQDVLVGGYAGIDDLMQAYLDLVEAGISPPACGSRCGGTGTAGSSSSRT